MSFIDLFREELGLPPSRTNATVSQVRSAPCWRLHLTRYLFSLSALCGEVPRPNAIVLCGNVGRKQVDGGKRNMTVVAAPGLERRLKAEVSGDVWFDRFTRGRYATDASHYQMMPVGVVAPRSVAEAERVVALARAEGVTVLPRGGGTSQSGQTVNHSLVLDCSKYLNRIIDVD